MVLEIVQERVTYTHSRPLLVRAHFGRGGAEVPRSRDLVWVFKPKCSWRTVVVEESRRGATQVSATRPNSHSSHSCVHACIMPVLMQNIDSYTDSALSKPE